LFYLKGLLKDNAQNKKATIKYLIGRLKINIMGLFKKDEKIPAVRKLKELLGIHIDRNKLYAENKNIYLSFKFRPKPYAGDLILISAKNKNKPRTYYEIYYDQERSENIKKWGNNISGKLYSHEVVGSHKDMMNEPAVKTIAQIINKNLLKD
jgi:hypothetical protein